MATDPLKKCLSAPRALFSVSIEERERNLIGFEPLSLATIRPGFANSDFATHGENDSFVLIESRLTENDFQSARKEVLLVYRDFCDVFEGKYLPRTEGRLQSYQLLRMRSPLVFLRRSFSVLVDARRVGVLNLAGNSKGFTTKASTFLAAKSGISG